MIPFTQYLRPDGRKRAVETDRPESVERDAHKFIAAGGVYEIEVLRTGHVSLTAAFPLADGVEDIATELAPNGPGLEAHVDRLVARSMDFLDHKTD